MHVAGCSEVEMYYIGEGRNAGTVTSRPRRASRGTQTLGVVTTTVGHVQGSDPMKKCSKTTEPITEQELA